MTASQNRTKREIVAFVVLVLGLAALASVIEPFTVPPDAEPGSPGLGRLLWLISPLAVALLLRQISGGGWSEFGLRPNFGGNGFWWLASLLVFPVVMAVTVFVGSLTGALTISTGALAGVAGLSLAGLAAASAKNVFEELAWRGYLAPRLYSLDHSVWLSHVIVGLVWGAWHLPFVFVFWPYLTKDMLWIFVPLLLIGTISQSVVYGEIRLATSSVLPAWVMHSVGNAIGNALLLGGYVAFAPGSELLFSPGVEGLVGIGLMFGIGYWLHRRGARTPKAPA